MGLYEGLRVAASSSAEAARFIRLRCPEQHSTRRVTVPSSPVSKVQTQWSSDVGSWGMYSSAFAIEVAETELLS